MDKNPLNKVFMNIANNIEVVSEKSPGKNSLGSLYEFFSSSFFNMNYLIDYLSSRDSEGIVQTLTNILYSDYKNESLFYLPQLLAIYLAKPTLCEPLHKFLVEKSLTHIFFCIRTKLIINDLVSKTTKQKCERAKALIAEIDDKTKNMFFGFYSNACCEFYFELGNTYETMKKIAVENNKYNEGNENNIKKNFGELIDKLNQRIIDLREALEKYPDESKDFKGFLIPAYPYFSNSTVFNLEEKNFTMVVNIVKNHSRVYFENMKQFTIKYCLETVNINDIKKWDSLYKTKVEVVDEEKSPVDIENLEGTSSKVVLNSNSGDFNNDPFLILDAVSSHIKTEIKKASHYQAFPSYSMKTYIAKRENGTPGAEVFNQLMVLFNQTFFNKDMPFSVSPFNNLAVGNNVSLYEKNEKFIPLKMLYTEAKERFSSFNIFFRYYFFNSIDESIKTFINSITSYILFCYVINNDKKIDETALMDKKCEINIYKFGSCFNVANLFAYRALRVPKEILELIEGKNSSMFQYYQGLIIKGIFEIKKNSEIFEKLIYITFKAYNPLYNLGFKDASLIIDGFRDRICHNQSEKETINLIVEAIKKANE